MKILNFSADEGKELEQTIKETIEEGVNARWNASKQTEERSIKDGKRRKQVANWKKRQLWKQMCEMYQWEKNYSIHSSIHLS